VGVVAIRSLQLRITLFMMVPVGALLIALAAAAFFYARGLLLAQWREASVLKLQRAAHEVDMRLGRIKDWIALFHGSSGERYSESFHAWVLENLGRQEGVVDIRLAWRDAQDADPAEAPGRAHGPESMRSGDRPHAGRGRAFGLRLFHGGKIREITPPRFDARGDHGTFSLISDLNDDLGQVIGHLEVAADFAFIFQGVVESGWWQSNRAFLVNGSGQILVGTEAGRQGRLGGSGDRLELETLAALDTRPFGTLLGSGYGSGEVSGFQRLTEAPWSLVMIAPGAEILAPVMRLQLIYLLVGTVSIAAIVALIRMVTLGTAKSIRRVSRAAQRLSRGDFGEPLPVQGRDEVGELTQSFNAMAIQLKERLRMKEAMSLAVEVQQHLLPRGIPAIPGFEVAARSLYCDETGGDFYDFFEHRPLQPGRFGVVVGDGSGHGVSAALLMATMRAALRARASQPGILAEVVSDVNRQVTRDTQETGHFVTLFYAEIDTARKSLDWVRAGHEPALRIDPATGGVDWLRGEGLAVGVDPDYVFSVQACERLQAGQVIFIGTDGVSETCNPAGERFGGDRLAGLLLACAHLSADEIAGSVLEALAGFRGKARPQDDVTLVVLKAVS
jgi:sigma-B regulation protein RsbU (phosphoserine phosphatase)